PLLGKPGGGLFRVRGKARGGGLDRRGASAHHADDAAHGDASMESGPRPEASSPASPVEIFSIGTELLIGRIQDTNSFWLAQQVSELGGTIGRISIVGDHAPTIVEALGDAVRRGAGTIMTTGGLGPTPDDLTVECVARLAGVGTVVHAPALADYVRRRD